MVSPTDEATYQRQQFLCYRIFLTVRGKCSGKIIFWQDIAFRIGWQFCSVVQQMNWNSNFLY